MNNIKIFTIGAVLTMALASCSDDYFDVRMDQNKTSETSFNTAKDVKNGLMGAYYALGNYRFYGRNVVALGDMAADIANADASSGHFVTLNTYQVTDTEEDLDDIWNYGYKVIDRCMRTINGAEKVLAAGVTQDEEIAINSYLSQCYALRALATFTLTNIFGLPYQANQTNDQLGVILIKDKPFTVNDKVSRSSVEDCYALVLDDIEKAKALYQDEEEMNGAPQFYFNLAAIYALEARVNLFMGNYPAAAVAAKNAITARDSEGVKNADYAAMWTSNAITAEDIFTITKTVDDNLSANSLNTLYGSYGASVSSTLSSKFQATDCRAAVLSKEQYKYCGLAGDKSVSNIPVFRLSEMYLILAECEVHQNNLTNAQSALLFTAKRDSNISSEADLPATKTGLLDFINDERVRELYLEGFRWFDARRQGLKITVATTIANYDVAKFVYPIPADEINSGFGAEQNAGWEDNLPE